MTDETRDSVDKADAWDGARVSYQKGLEAGMKIGKAASTPRFTVSGGFGADRGGMQFWLDGLEFRVEKNPYDEWSYVLPSGERYSHPTRTGALWMCLKHFASGKEKAVEFAVPEEGAAYHRVAGEPVASVDEAMPGTYSAADDSVTHVRLTSAVVGGLIKQFGPDAASHAVPTEEGFDPAQPGGDRTVYTTRKTQDGGGFDVVAIGKTPR